jgi:hypothetical protein
MDQDPRLTALEELSLRLLWHDEMGLMVKYVAAFGWEEALERRLRDLHDLINQQVDKTE